MGKKIASGIRKALAVFCFLGVVVYVCVALFEQTAADIKTPLFILAVIFAGLGVLLWPKKRKHKEQLPVTNLAASDPIVNIDRPAPVVTVETEYIPDRQLIRTDVGEPLNGDQISTALSEAFYGESLDPDQIRLDRHGESSFSIFYAGIFLGRFDSWLIPDKWAIKKPGSTRATRVFDTEIEARELVAQRPEYQIEYRRGGGGASIMYMCGLYDQKEITSPTVEQIEQVIQQWARYAKEQKAEMDRALRP